MRREDRFIDEYITRLPEEKVLTYCVHCHNDIYVDEYCYKTDDGLVHEDCFSEYADDVLVVYKGNMTEEDL